MDLGERQGVKGRNGRRRNCSRDVMYERRIKQNKTKQVTTLGRLRATVLKEIWVCIYCELSVLNNLSLAATWMNLEDITGS